MTRAWRRLEELVPTRGAAAALFVVALGVFWIHALGWPMAKGATRGTTSPTTSSSRTPAAARDAPALPNAAHAARGRDPLDLGGTVLLEVVFGLLFVVTVLAWSATALTFGRLPAVLVAVLLLVYPMGDAVPPGLSDAVFATGLALWEILLARTLSQSVDMEIRCAAGSPCSVSFVPRTRCCCRPCSPRSWFPSPGAGDSAGRPRASAAAVAILGAWAVHNGVRYDDATVARGGRA